MNFVKLYKSNKTYFIFADWFRLYPKRFAKVY